ncbi:MAG TPA: PP0621 family protein [Zeimonas sp.]|nr:PP0621 family protein [Zeimonas sp.]
MGKLLSWVALVALAYLAFRLAAISQRKRDAAERARSARDAGVAAGGPTRRVGGEMMVQCAHCGVFLPASDAFVDGDRSYCDRAHRDADRAAQTRE